MNFVLSFVFLFNLLMLTYVGITFAAIFSRVYHKVASKGK